MSYRSSPSFAVGGVSYLNHNGEMGDVVLPIEGRWICFHCGESFTTVRSAQQHFGKWSNEIPECIKAMTGRVSPYLAHAVERALHAARIRLSHEREMADRLGQHTLGLEAISDDVESLEEAVEVLRKMERT